MNEKTNTFLETEPVGALMCKYAVLFIISLLVAGARARLRNALNPFEVSRKTVIVTGGLTPVTMLYALRS